MPKNQGREKKKLAPQSQGRNLLTSFSVALLGGIYDVRDGHFVAHLTIEALQKKEKA